MKRSEMRRPPAPIPTEDRSSVEPRVLPASLGGPGEAKPPPTALPAGALRVPHDPVNEQILLAAAFALDRERRRELLRDAPAEHFFGKGHKELWTVLREADSRGLELTFDLARQLGGPDVDPAYLESLLASRPEPPPNLRHHVERLRWDAARIDAAQGPLADLIERFKDQRCEPAMLASAARHLADDLSSGIPASGVLDPASLLAANRAAYEARSLGEACWPYGIDGFEREKDGAWRVKPGMQPGKVTVVTALSGHGKSILAKAISLGQAGRARRVLFGAFEDQPGETLEDIAAMHLGVSRDAVDEGRLLLEERERFFSAQEQLAVWIKFMRRPPREGKRARSTVTGKIEWAFAEAARVGADAVVFDLLARLLESAKPEEEQRAWECFQRCAEESRIHGLATHQQRLGDVEQRRDQRPTREGLKGSKGVVEVADTLIGVHRPALADPSVKDDAIEAIVLKQRRGRWPFAVRFDFDPKTWRISGGREVAYTRPGEDGLDDMVERPSRGGRSGR